MVDGGSQPYDAEYLQKMDLSDSQIADLFMGCLMVILVQCSVIALVINLWVQDPSTSYKSPNAFSIFVPRFLSSIMMHLMCEPGI